MKLCSLVLILLFMPLAAQAQNLPTYCRLLPAYVPSTGVEYVPGIDVHGKPVVPADLNSITQPLQSPIIIPIEVDLVDRFHLNAPQGVGLNPYVAFMKIEADGRILYNDQDISAQAYALCGKTPEFPAKNTASPDGQRPENGLISGNAPVMEETPPQGALIEGQYP